MVTKVLENGFYSVYVDGRQVAIVFSEYHANEFVALLESL